MPVPATEDCLESIVVGYPLSLSLPLAGRLIDLNKMKHFNKTTGLTADSDNDQVRSGQVGFKPAPLGGFPATPGSAPATSSPPY